MSVMVLDAGNSIIKAKIARRENGEIAFPHTMKQVVLYGEVDFHPVLQLIVGGKYQSQCKLIFNMEMRQLKGSLIIFSDLQN